MVLNPATPAVMLEDFLHDVDLVLVMTVNPGFGGQKFIASTLGKIRRLRQMIDQIQVPRCELEVDGGIDADTAPQAVQAGAACSWRDRRFLARPTAWLRRWRGCGSRWDSGGNHRCFISL